MSIGPSTGSTFMTKMSSTLNAQTLMKKSTWSNVQLRKLLQRKRRERSLKEWTCRFLAGLKLMLKILKMVKLIQNGLRKTQTMVRRLRKCWPRSLRMLLLRCRLSKILKTPNAAEELQTPMSPKSKLRLTIKLRQKSRIEISNLNNEYLINFK